MYEIDEFLEMEYEDRNVNLFDEGWDAEVFDTSDLDLDYEEWDNEE